MSGHTYQSHTFEVNNILTAAQMNMLDTGILEALSGVDKAVFFAEEQTLTNDQQLQARNNIGAMDAEAHVVLYDSTTPYDSTVAALVRSNIDAASVTEINTLTSNIEVINNNITTLTNNLSDSSGAIINVNEALESLKTEILSNVQNYLPQPQLKIYHDVEITVDDTTKKYTYIYIPTAEITKYLKYTINITNFAFIENLSLVTLINDTEVKNATIAENKNWHNSFIVSDTSDSTAIYPLIETSRNGVKILIDNNRPNRSGTHYGQECQIIQIATLKTNDVQETNYATCKRIMTFSTQNVIVQEEITWLRDAFYNENSYLAQLPLYYENTVDGQTYEISSRVIPEYNYNSYIIDDSSGFDSSALIWSKHLNKFFKFYSLYDGFGAQIAIDSSLPTYGQIEYPGEGHGSSNYNIASFSYTDTSNIAVAKDAVWSYIVTYNIKYNKINNKPTNNSEETENTDEEEEETINE